MLNFETSKAQMYQFFSTAMGGMERYRHPNHQTPMFTNLPPHAATMQPRIATSSGMLHHQPQVGYHPSGVEQTRGVLHHQVNHHPEHPQGMYPQMTAFSLEDLDRVLFGYAKCSPTSNHALSGLRIGELSYGIDRLLGSWNQGVLHPSLKTATNTSIDTNTLDIPQGLEVFKTIFAGVVHYGVVNRKASIPKGTQFGPFMGKAVNASEIKSHDDNTFMWEIFKDGKLSHFIDGRGSTGNWMAFVNGARFVGEQNLVAIQIDSQIYYQTCKDITQGEELLVWYDDDYMQFMGIPISLKEVHQESPLQKTENASEGYACERCGKVFAYKYYRDKHLKYTRCVDQGDRKFPCHLCKRSFEKRDRLRIHILHVHEKHRPHRCSVCGKSFSQSSSLNKHMRVHSGERPYKCVYCSKAFTASSILRTHIRQHSGEKPFKCKHCGKAFASHAAHDSHVRRTHSKLKDTAPFACHVCGKIFLNSQQLQFHQRIHHEGALSEKKELLSVMEGMTVSNAAWISPERRPAENLSLNGSSDSSPSFMLDTSPMGSADRKPNINHYDDSIDVVG